MSTNNTLRTTTVTRAPLSGRTARRLGLLLGSAAIGTLMPHQALAQCVTSDGQNYLCENANLAGQAISRPMIQVTTMPGFSVESPDDAVSITGTAGETSYRDANASELRSSSVALRVVNDAMILPIPGGLSYLSGPVIIETAGKLTGTAGGIIVSNTGVSGTTITATGAIASRNGIGVLVNQTPPVGAPVQHGGVTITTGNIAATSGIIVQNSGGGATTITANGTIAASNYGIYVEDKATALDMTITAGTTSGSIIAVHNGTGLFNITATGTTTNGSQLYGILALGGTAGSDVNISAEAVKAVEGVLVSNSGAGKTTVTTTGDVIASSGRGVVAQNVAAGTDLSIRTASVTAKSSGIVATNNGTGSTAVTTSGLVASAEQYGIYASDTTSAKDMTINAATTDGHFMGVYAWHQGTGDLNVTTTGTTTGGVAGGINAQNDAGATNLTVTTGDTVSGHTGISASNNGNGATMVSANGAVIGTAADGITAFNGIAATDLTVSVTDVSGKENGIAVNNPGTGRTSVTATGLVTADNETAINVVGGQNSTDMIVHAAAASGKSGVSAYNQGSGATSVTSTGAITSTGFSGVSAQNTAAGTDVSIIAQGDVNGHVSGVLAFNFGKGTTSVTTTGNVRGGLLTGVYAEDTALGKDMTVETATTRGTGYGIFARHHGTGDLNVTTSGTTTGDTDRGIFAQNDALATNLSITAGGAVKGTTGIFAFNNGIGATKVTATDQVTGMAGDGLTVHNGGTATDLIVAATAVRGTDNGIVAVNLGIGATSITATGNVVGELMTGVEVGDSIAAKDMTVTTGTTHGGEYGLYARHRGTGDLTVTTTGTTTGDNNRGIFAQNDALGTNLLVNAGGAVSGTTGIFAFNNGNGSAKISATDQVTGTAGDGLVAYAASAATDLTVSAAGVNGSDNGIVVFSVGSGVTSVTATGPVVGGTARGIEVTGDYGSDVTLRTAKVTGATDGIYVRNIGSGATSVIATGDVQGGARNGIDVAGGALTGLVATRGTTLTVAAGNVTGAINGVLANNRGTGATSITTTGDVLGGTGNGIQAASASGSGGMTIAAGKTSGGTNGIIVTHLGTGALKFSATGDVTGANGAGVNVTTGLGATDTIIDVVNTSGSNGGVNVRSVPLGDNGRTLVTSTGTASGHGFAGINISTGTTSGDVVLKSNIATGTAGVQVVGQGRGAIDIVATGASTGTRGDGIYGVNFSQNGGDVTIVNSGTATGGRHGIIAQSSGAGAKTIVHSTGDAIGGSAVDQTGIFAVSRAGAGDVVVTAGNASGYRGIRASSWGNGSASVVASGTVTGVAEAIYADAQALAGAITITANNASGGTAGIGIDNAGTGDAAIVVNGVVEGGTAGIVAITTSGRALSITNNGIIRNSSAASSTRAISVTDGALLFNNTGTLLGIVTAVGAADIFNNSGAWNSIGGTSDFGIGNDRVNNLATGRIIGGTSAAIAETTTYANLDMFMNAGTIALRDGGTGDRFLTSGALTLQSGSLLTIDIGAGNTSDLVAAGGAVTIQPGARLSINGLAPNSVSGLQAGPIGSRYTFLTAGGGLTGTFDIPDSYVSSFLGLRDGYTTNSAYIEFAQLRALSAAGRTSNQVATARGMDTLAITNPVRLAALNLANDDQARGAFDQVSGEIHPTMRTVMAEETRLPRNAVLDRLGADRSGGSIWGQMFGNHGTSDGNSNAAATNRKSYGFLAGADFGADEDGGLIAGMAAGYIDTKVRIDDRASSGSVKAVHGLAYVGTRLGGLSIKAGIGYAHGDITTRRSVAFAGFSDKLTADYGGHLWQGFAELGYRVSLGGGYVEPFVGLNGVRARSNRVTEAGGAAAVFVASTRTDTVASTAGLRFETSASGPISVGGSIGWQHGFGRLTPVNANSLAGSDRFLISGAGRSRDAGVAGVALRYRISPNADLQLGYDGVLGTAAQDHAATATLRFRF